MINLKITTHFPKEIFRLKELLGGDIIENYGIYILKFNNTKGQGTIKQHILKNNSVAIDFDIFLQEDLVYKIGDKENDLLYFIYCTKGFSFFKSETNENYLGIEELRPCVASGLKTENNQINIKKGAQFTFNLLSINKDTYFKRFFENSISQTKQVKKMLNAFNLLKSSFSQNAYNLKIAEKLRVINSLSKNYSITNILKIESKYQYIIATHLDLFYNEIYEKHAVASLSKIDLQKIREITKHIIDCPEAPHSITALCKKTFISPAKLQEGFKGMHDTTVADFVRNVRIEKAEKLLIETDFNISEIVYKIGLTSRSYFCKIFKDKYNCSPKNYRKTVRS